MSTMTHDSEQLYWQSLSASTVPYESRFYQTSFGETHVLLAGPEDAPPLVILHGWNGNASSFYREYPFLLNRVRIYAVDVIGQTGLSAKVSLSTSNNDYAVWLESLLDEMVLNSPNVLGFSGGGWITLKLMATSTSRIGRAALLSTVGLSNYTFEAAFYAILASTLKIDWAIRGFGSLQVADPAKSPQEFDEFIKYLKPQFMGARPVAIPMQIPTQQLRRITTPVVLLMGEKEHILRPKAAIVRARDTIPGLRQTNLIAGAGHLMTFDQPEIVNSILTEFFGLPQ